MSASSSSIVGTVRSTDWSPLLPTVAPTSQYLDSNKEIVAWISIVGIIFTMGWIVMYFVRRIRYPKRMSDRIKNKNDIRLEGGELYLHHTLATYEEVKQNPTHYYMMDPSGNTSIMTPLDPNAYISPYRAYIRLPFGLTGRSYICFAIF